MVISTTIQPGQRYIVITNTITYNSITYNVGDQFIGVSGFTTYTGSGSAVEIMQLTSAGLEIISPLSNIVFPEQLTIYSSGMEINGLGSSQRNIIVLVNTRITVDSITGAIIFYY